MKQLLLALRLSLLLLILAEQYTLAVWAGPDIEASVLPVIRRQAIDGLDRLDGGRTLCFTWRFDKVRPARVTDANWTLRAGDDVYPFQRVRTFADSEDVRPALVARPVKPGQWTRKCIDVPEPLLGRPFRLAGFVEYRTRWTGRLWPVRHQTPEVFAP